MSAPIGVELHLAAHLSSARAKLFLRAAAQSAVTWADADQHAVVTTLLAQHLDAAVIAQAERLLRTSARPVVVAVAGETGDTQSDSLNALLRAGVWNVLIEADDAALAAAISACAARMHRVEIALNSDVVRANLMGSSAAWRALVREVVWAAKFSNASMLLLGETGTGKDLLARLIHTLDERPDKGELVVVDCTTLTSELAVSELFGHERGAFTGAHTQRAGAAQLANGGTLFLDEIGELHLTVQAQLLRLLQEGTYKSVGSSTWHRSSFRLVCATHRDLTEAVAAGRFRQDLYFRIAGWESRVPPLRDRAEDIPPLANRFLAEFGCDQGIDPYAERALAGHSFPGNVRELRQLMMQTAVKHCGTSRISVGDLPISWHAGKSKDKRINPLIDSASDSVSTQKIEDQIIRDWVRAGVGLRDIAQRAGDIAIAEALAVESNQVGRAARRLGITERAIQLRKAQRSTPAANAVDAAKNPD